MEEEQPREERRENIDRLTYKSSIALIPPRECWPQIQEIRKLYDRTYVRWPPHINMLYPFVHNDKFPEAAAKLAPVLAQIPPFTVRFETFDYFEHKSSCTAWLKPVTEPPDALIALQRVLEQTFPDCNELSAKSEEGFVPHLSVGNDFRTQSGAAQYIEPYKEGFAPIEFRVQELYFISRFGRDYPFDVRHVIPLLGAGEPHFVPRPIPPGAPADHPSRVALHRLKIEGVPAQMKEAEFAAILARELRDKLQIELPARGDCVKLNRKTNTSGRKNKNLGTAYVELGSSEDRQRVLAARGVVVAAGNAILRFKETHA